MPHEITERLFTFQTKALWDWLLPAIKTAFANLSSETADWWIANLTYAFVSAGLSRTLESKVLFSTQGDRDPKKLAVIITAFMENPLNGEGGSFLEKWCSAMIYSLLVVIFVVLQSPAVAGGTYRPGRMARA
jgi:membrane-associated PAP2 superfamily phosphatase